MAIDYSVFELQRTADKEFNSISGVLVENAAKTTHRHRQNDLFSIQITSSGSPHLDELALTEMAKIASGIFFHAKGSVTKAIQTVIDALNKDFYALNADLSQDGKQVLGSANICVLHNNWLFMGQIGDAVAYHIGENVYEIFGENSKEPEKLGISRRVQAKFHQCAITPGDIILLSPRSHGSWKSYYLANSHKVPIDQLKRRLHNQMIQDFSVVVIKTSDGSGKVHKGNWENTQELAGEDLQQKPSVLEDSTSSGLDTQEDPPILIPEVEIGPLDNEDPSGEIVVEPNPAIEADEKVLPVSEGQTETSISASVEEDSGLTTSSQAGGKFLRQIAHFWMNGKTLRAKAQLLVSRIKRKVLPESNALPGQSKGWQTAAIILIPAILTISSIFLFTNSGKKEQYDAYINLAHESSTLAEQAESDSEKKALWSEVMNLAISAENYRITSESRQMFLKAQAIVDEMDLSSRLTFRPAITQPFPDGVQISRIKDSPSGVYLLDSTSGNVLRASTNSKGFLELDNDFKCSPGGYGLVEMGKIIDFVILPANNLGYKVLAIDDNGDLLYCQPGETPDSKTLTTPDVGWGAINRVIYSDGRLYVVDSPKNEIHIFESENEGDLKGIVFVEAPLAFFDAEKPDIGGSIDAILNLDELYILHEDGHMTVCQYGYEDVRETECVDPSPFTDNRTGSENKNPWIFMGTDFVLMGQSTLPNPSLFVLDQISGSFFQFSMQLNLEKTYKPQINPDFPLPDTSPTGFGILSDQQLLFAFNNQLFTAALQ